MQTSRTHHARTRAPRVVATVSIALGLVLTATACATGSSTDPAAAPTEATDEVYLVGTCIGAPPYGDFAEDGITFESFEADIIRAIAEEQNLEVGFSVLENVGLFTALDSGRLDMLSCGMVDKKSRQEKYDLLNDAKDATGFLVRSGETGILTEMTDACGLTLGVTAGTSQEAFWADFTEECAASDLEPVDLLTFPNEATSFTALRSGQIDAMSTNLPVLEVFAAGSDGATEVVPDLSYLEGYVGFLFPKDSPLSLTFQEGLEKLIDSGEYSQIMERWGLGYLEVDEALFNQGTAE